MFWNVRAFSKFGWLRKHSECSIITMKTTLKTPHWCKWRSTSAEKHTHSWLWLPLAHHPLHVNGERDRVCKQILLNAQHNRRYAKFNENHAQPRQVHFVHQLKFIAPPFKEMRIRNHRFCMLIVGESIPIRPKFCILISVRHVGVVRWNQNGGHPTPPMMFAWRSCLPFVAWNAPCCMRCGAPLTDITVSVAATELTPQ